MIPQELKLRPWQNEDLVDLVRLADNPKIASQSRDTFRQPYTEEAGKAWLQIATQPDATVFVIEYNGQFAGGIGYHPGKDIERCNAEIGYWLGEPFWGKGLATQAVKLLVEKVKATGQFTRLFAMPFAANQGSRRVLEKAGFTLDAVLSRAAVKNGQIKDICIYSMVIG